MQEIENQEQELNEGKANEVKELKARGFTVDEETGKTSGFNANFFVDYITRIMRIKYTKDNNFYIYQTKTGVWRKREEGKVLKSLREILQKPRHGIWSSKREDEYVKALKREAYDNRDMNPNRYLINLKNGMFDINTFTLLPHDAKYLSTIQIPVEYDENAECPRFLRFVEEIFEGDRERIAVAQEWFGYALTTETKAQKALILYGTGANGKGVFTDVLTMLIGNDNISNIPLNELNKGFSRVCLFNKTANICNENESDGKALNTQYFKAIVGEDMINAEQKNKPVFSFKPTVKFILSMNNLPLTKDKSHGYYRRLMILNFTAHFSEEKRDKDLKDKLREELPGIFLWAIEGLKRLRENNYRFSECENMKSTLREYEVEQNPLLHFFEEKIRKPVEAKHRENNKVIYDSFREWATSNGHSGYSGISTKRFWREFEAAARSLGYKCESGRSNTLRYHTGVALIKESEIVRPVKNTKTPYIGEELELD